MPKLSKQLIVLAPAIVHFTSFIGCAVENFGDEPGSNAKQAQSATLGNVTYENLGNACPNVGFFQDVLYTMSVCTVMQDDLGFVGQTRTGVAECSSFTTTRSSTVGSSTTSFARTNADIQFAEAGVRYCVASPRGTDGIFITNPGTFQRRNPHRLIIWPVAGGQPPVAGDPQVLRWSGGNSHACLIPNVRLDRCGAYVPKG